MKEYSEHSEELSSKMDPDECGFKCVKFLVILFNFLFWVAGCVVFGIGIWLHNGKGEVASDYTQMSDNINYLSGPNLCISIGVFTIIVAFLACCGAYLENQCMLGTYFACLVVILCLELTAISLTYIYREKIHRDLREDIKNTLNNYRSPGHEGVSKAIDELQKDFHCCGNTGYEDWFKTRWGQDHDKQVPRSCCKNPNDHDCNENASSDSSKVYTRGCYKLVYKFLTNNLHVISGFAIWIVVIQVLGMAFSMCLCCRIRSGEGEYV